MAKYSYIHPFIFKRADFILLAIWGTLPEAEGTLTYVTYDQHKPEKCYSSVAVLMPKLCFPTELMTWILRAHPMKLRTYSKNSTIRTPILQSSVSHPHSNTNKLWVDVLIMKTVPHEISIHSLLSSSLLTVFTKHPQTLTVGTQGVLNLNAGPHSTGQDSFPWRNARSSFRQFCKSIIMESGTELQTWNRPWGWSSFECAWRSSIYKHKVPNYCLLPTIITVVY